MKKRLLIFLIPLLYALNFKYGIDLSGILFMLVWLLGSIANLLYPILSAAFFYNNKLLIWTTPIVAVFVTVWPYYINGNGDQLTQIILYAGVLYIPYSLICTIVAVVNRRKTEKNSLP